MVTATVVGIILCLFQYGLGFLHGTILSEAKLPKRDAKGRFLPRS